MKAILFEPTKRPRIIDIENDLHALQKAVDGPIETVTLDKFSCFICNEEGRLRNLPKQWAGRRLWYGNVLLVGVKGDEFCDVPVRDLATLRR